jgi:D-alanyl-D-alanine carboxypeptidase
LYTTRRTFLRVGAAAAMSVAAVSVTPGTVAGSAAAAPPIRHRPARGPDPKALRQVLNDLVDAGAVGVKVELTEPSRVWRGAAGVAKLGTSRPVPVHGRFRMGSVTKTFVATVVLQLAAERRLCLDDTVERWLPGLLPDGARITVRHLLQHTSGVPEYMSRFYDLHPTTADVLRQRFRRWSLRELLALVDGTPTLFEPGADWSYANTNYTVLGLLIRRVTGHDYGTEIRRRILRPLRLRHTLVPGNRTGIPGPHAHGYLADDQTGRPVDSTVFNPSIAGPAGDLISTAGDLNRFFGALVGGRLLPSELRAQMKDGFPVSDQVEYGLGLLRLRLPGIQELWGHTGYFFGYDTVTVSTDDGRRQLTMSTTPLGDVDLFTGLVGLLTVAFPHG